MPYRPEATANVKRVLDQPEPPQAGDVYADYSPITPEEIAQPDPELDALFKRSNTMKASRPAESI